MTSLSEFRRIPQGTFMVTQEIEYSDSRWRTRRVIGPVAEYTDDEILFHFGGDRQFGSRVARHGPTEATVHIWED